MLKDFKKLYMLFAIAKLIEEKKMPISTRELSKVVNMSHQSVSRYLKELEKEGLIESVIFSKGHIINLSGKGLNQLKLHAGTVLSLISKIDSTHIFTGRVFTGLGEGAYYVSRRPYLEQFYSKLGFYPYPGTLNLRIELYIDQLLLIEKMSKPPIYIQSFIDHERAFGDGYCYPVIVNGTYEGAIVKALRTAYDSSVVEIISPHNFRKELGLKDGDKVTFVFRNVMPDRK
ncbi:MAG: DUF120 domain-containing protein [Thermoproteota archaeon]